MSDVVGFWAEGEEDHLKALFSAEKAEVKELRKRMVGASADEVAALRQEIEVVRQTYAEKRRLAENNLYLAP